MNKSLITAAGLALALSASAQTVSEYVITSPAAPLKVVEGGLKMGGTSPAGGSISVNNYYMSIDGKPVIPVLGEFHFTRYPREQWEEEIVKMKAGGVTVLPTYIFWAQHEEVEGQFQWTGGKDLRHFIELCAKHDMPVIVRIGPFCHGEMRQGSFPDWLFAKPLEVRSNDPLYLEYVGRLYHEIALQLKGLYYKDGGPIIGCQIENEMQHSASPWGVFYPGEPLDYTTADSDKDFTLIGVGVQDKEVSTSEQGDIHMKTLLQMAKDEGIITPFYTATGWGYAAVLGNEGIPVTSAYTYPFWEKPRMSQFCMFKDLHKEPDYSPVRYNPEDFPSFCAEMGAGIQMTYSRRPIVTARAAQALMIRTLGSGCNGIGYYMYHGGSTPLRRDAVGSFQDEPMGMPKISYDFQAPLGEFGLEHESYRYLRTIHSFLADFGELLAPMETVLPEGWEKMTPENRDDLRYAVRVKDGRGFLFMVNFQDHDSCRHDQTGLSVEIDGLRIPSEGSFTLPKDESVILPFNLRMGSVNLRYATSQPLMKIDDGGIDHYIFFAPDGMQPEYVFDRNTIRGKAVRRVSAGTGSTFTVTGRDGVKVRITTLTHKEALNAAKVNGKILISEATVLSDADGISLQQLYDPDFRYVLYPSESGWKEQVRSVEAVHPQCEVRKVGTRRMSVKFDPAAAAKPQVHEYFLKLDYVGDVAMAFLEGKMVQDEFWHGEPWIIGLKRHYDALGREGMSFYLRPINKGHECLQDLPAEVRPDFGVGDAVLEIRDVEIVPQYRIEL